MKYFIAVIVLVMVALIVNAEAEIDRVSATTGIDLTTCAPINIENVGVGKQLLFLQQVSSMSGLTTYWIKAKNSLRCG